jgi:CRISPR type III-B/RAMP module RAMP protein Cmr1
MSWTTFTLRVQTPLFSGDDPASRSGDSPIRVPSIRGVLRFWFRAVAAGHGITDPTELWKAEKEVFGSTDKPSPIRLRIDDSPVASGVGSTPDWAGGDHHRGFHGAQYLLGQGLWKYGHGLTRPFVAPKATVGLKIRLSDNEPTDHRFLLAMWAWLTYGGLGARTRRGFGQLRCTRIEGDLPAPFSNELKTIPNVATWRKLASSAVPAELRRPNEIGWERWVDGRREVDERLPDSPALTPKWWNGLLLDDRSSSMGKAFDTAGRRWRNFRAASDLIGTPQPDTHSPEWVNAIHGVDKRYPIAALGLPVGYFSREKPGRPEFKAAVQPIRQLNDEAEPELLRRSSPVWLRPVQVENGDWRLFTHVFRAALLPDLTGLYLVQDGVEPRPLDMPSTEAIDNSWNVWLKGRKRLPHGYYDEPGNGA